MSLGELGFGLPFEDAEEVQAAKQYEDMLARQAEQDRIAAARRNYIWASEAKRQRAQARLAAGSEPAELADLRLREAESWQIGLVARNLGKYFFSLASVEPRLSFEQSRTRADRLNPLAGIGLSGRLGDEGLSQRLDIENITRLSNEEKVIFPDSTLESTQEHTIKDPFRIDKDKY